MLIWLVTQAAHAKTPTVSAEADPMMRAETAFCPVVGSADALSVAGTRAGAAGRATVAVAMI
jgi:hypothetical protein